MVNEIDLDPRTIVKLKDIEIELVEGDLKEKPWLIEDKQDKYVLLEEEQYNKILQLLKFSLQENLDLKMDQRIMEEFPIDLEDVKAVVKKRIEDDNISIDEAIKKIKNENKNLFYSVSLDEFLNLL